MSDSTGLTGAEARLVDSAKAGYQLLLEPDSPRTLLTCGYCEATLLRPTTLGDGSTFCKSCVPKVTRAVGREVGFGKATNKVLEHMAESWFAAGYRAAQLRQEGNEHFSGGRHVEAVSFYTQALAHFPDAVLLSNRAAARLRLSDRDGALRDACLAARLSKPGSRLWAKSLFRLGSALNALGTHPASALAALSTAAAWTRAEGEPLDATLRALREASAAFARASSLADDPSLVSMDTLLADLRAGRALARATSIADVEAELAAAQASAAAAAAVPASTVLASRDNVECALCVDQLYEPTVIPCGHVLCRSCLSRALDQAFDTPARCPLCRDDLAPFLCWLNVRARHEAARTRRRHEHGALQLAVCRELQAILAAYLPDEMAARAAQVRAAEAAAGEEGADAEGEHRATIPIFICSLALPGVRCPLHVFEPRYRLMMRRCIDSGRREFGMVLSPEVGYGTTLLIDEFTQLPDGRARVATTGSRRFRVLEWGNKDGARALVPPSCACARGARR